MYNQLAQDEPDALSESDYSQIAASPVDDLEDKRGRRSPNLDYRSTSSYSDAMDPPRTVSREGSVLRHPTPDLQALQGAYVSNVERLERSAERLSLSSSGIGEELRKMREEQRKPESRRSSVLSSPIEDDERRPPLSRQTSYGYGTYASNSILGTNTIARSGGFSPAAYVASPRGSIRSGSWSQHTSVKERSASYGPRLTQLSEPEQEGKPLDSPLSSRLVPVPQDFESPTSALQVTNNENYNLNDVEIPHTHSEITQPGQEGEPRPSVDTARQASGLFADFDGVHTEYHPDRPSDIQQIADRRASGQSRPASRIMSYIQPPPGENMVYYPAPVPMMLNLPKRLSKLPQAAQREKRQSELLSSLPVEARKSAAWLPDTNPGSDEGVQSVTEPMVNLKASKRRTMADIPPQLRASMFFDQPTVPHDIEVRGESAVETLDSILDASAFAPVSAFTDHPYAGRAGAGVYSKEVHTSKVNNASTPRKRRSTIDLLTKRNSSTDLLDEARKSPNVLRKRDSNSNLLEGTKKRNSSVFSLGTFGKRKSDSQFYEDANKNEDIELADVHGEDAPLTTPAEDGQADTAGEYYSHEEYQEAGPHLQVEDEEQIVESNGAPTTLLAELQMRKQQQKLRNRTAATAFPNGMHTTLLELDAVDQIQKQKRKQRHTTLAWEDPNAHHSGIENEDDEDVPLGVLFAGRKLDTAEKSRRMDEDRPLGLIARREMEDNEPLSHRRARLRGEEPVHRNASPEKRNSMYTLDLPNLGGDNLMDETPKNADGNEDETLGQRIRRFKATQIRVQSRPVSGDFASEMMSQFGGPSPSEQPPAGKEPLTPNTTTQTPDPEETLGQRRKRLQAEASKSRQASGESSDAAAAAAAASRPPMSKRRSMADILQAHPAAGAGSPAVRVLSNEIKFAPAPKTRNTPWAVNKTREASMGATLPMASGIGAPANAKGMSGGRNGFANGSGEYVPHPMMVQRPVKIDGGRREMVDRWRQSVHY